MRVRLVAGLLGVLLLATLPTAGRADAAQTAYPGGRYRPPAASFGTTTLEDQRVRMSDGATLRYEITFPTNRSTGKRASGPFPVIITHDPYASGATGALEAGAGIPFSEYSAQRGYIYLHLNQRGTGGPLGLDSSEGSAELFDSRSTLDLVETAYWAAEPRNVPGSNGKIGLEGCSYLGITQIAMLNQIGRLQRQGGTVFVPGPTIAAAGHEIRVTPENNPVVAAIPACSNGDFYRDTLFDNGIPGATWTLFAAGPALGGVNFSEPSANVEADELLLDMLNGGAISYDRQFYKDRNWVEHAPDIARTGVPMLFWTGWNEPGGQGNPWLYAALQNEAAGRPWYAPMEPGQQPSPKYQMIMGDWAHGGGLDPGIQLEWFDTWIKGVDSGLRTASEPLHIKELPTKATGRWINAKTYPMVAKSTPYYLAKGGRLTVSKPTTAASTTLPWAPVVSTKYTLGSTFDRDMTLIGPSAMTLWLKSNNNNAQILATLFDVPPSGPAQAITHASVLGSRRKISAARSWYDASGFPVQPYLTLDADRYLTPGSITRLDFPLQTQTWRLLKGHKLQLRLTTQMPEQECFTALIGRPGGCNFSKPMLKTLPGGIYTIMSDPQHPSLVNVPLVPSSSLKTAHAGVTPTSGGVTLPQDWG